MMAPTLSATEAHMTHTTHMIPEVMVIIGPIIGLIIDRTKIQIVTRALETVFPKVTITEDTNRAEERVVFYNYKIVTYLAIF